MSRFSPPVTTRLADKDAEAVRRNHEQRLVELQAQRFPVVVRGVVLLSGIETEVPHGLGRIPDWVCPGAPMGAAAAGVIALFGDVHGNGTPIDRTKVIVLQAVGFGATITVDVAFL